MERQLKTRASPEFRCRMHQTRPSALFSPIFSRAWEKIGPPEARQKRPRRNEPPQATSLILCAHFFLSKPQTEFAVWVFLCKFDTPVSGGAYQNIRKVTIVWNDACNIGSCLSSDAESTKRIPAPFSPLSFPAQGKR